MAVSTEPVDSYDYDYWTTGFRWPWLEPVESYAMTIEPGESTCFCWTSGISWLSLLNQWIQLATIIQAVETDGCDYWTNEARWLWLLNKWNQLAMTIEPVDSAGYNYSSSGARWLWLSNQWSQMAMTIEQMESAGFDYWTSGFRWLWLFVSIASIIFVSSQKLKTWLCEIWRLHVAMTGNAIRTESVLKQ